MAAWTNLDYYPETTLHRSVVYWLLMPDQMLLQLLKKLGQKLGQEALCQLICASEQPAAWLKEA